MLAVQNGGLRPTLVICECLSGPILTLCFGYHLIIAKFSARSPGRVLGTAVVVGGDMLDGVRAEMSFSNNGQL